MRQEIKELKELLAQLVPLEAPVNLAQLEQQGSLVLPDLKDQWVQQVLRVPRDLQELWELQEQ